MISNYLPQVLTASSSIQPNTGLELTPEDVLMAKKKLGTAFLVDFIQFTLTTYVTKFYHRLLCDYLDRLLAGEIKRLMVFTAPQHGKTEIVSRRLPAFALGRNPKLKIASCTYAAEFAERLNREVQRIISSPEYAFFFPGTRLNEKSVVSDAKENFLRNSSIFEVVGKGGSYTSIGVGGPLTGKTVDLGIIDDPIKDSQEAQSPTYRNRLWDWYIEVFSTRLHNDSRVVYTCTRWHEDDLAGRILAKEPELWKVFIIPGVREPDGTFERIYPPECLLKFHDPRQIGEALWPKKHSLEKLLQVKKNSERTFASMIQQRPAPTEGNIIKKEWIKFYRQNQLPQRMTKIIQSWDLAFGGEATSDYVACTVWGIAGPNAFLLYMTRGKWDFVQTLTEMRKMRKTFPMTSELLIEDKANGPAAISVLKREIPGLLAVPAEKSKESRTYAVSFLFESGNVWFPFDRSWTADVVNELAMFPNGRYDDIVDTITQALTHLFLRRHGRAVLAAF